MPRLPASLLALALGAAAAVALVACGGGESAKLLPGETAREITANLETVKQLAGEGDCVGAESAAQQVSEQIAALTGVDRKLKQALEGGAERLGEAVARCEESSVEAIAPAEEPAEGEEKASKAEEKEARELEKARKKEDKEAPAAEPEGGKAPPESPGKAKGTENGNGPPTGGNEEAPAEVSPSGGVGPGAPAGEGGR